MCSPGHKGHDDLTSSPPSSALTAAVPRGFPASPDGNTRRGLRSLRDLTQHHAAAIKQAKASADCVIFSANWGKTEEPMPTEYEKEWANFLM